MHLNAGMVLNGTAARIASIAALCTTATLAAPAIWQPIASAQPAAPAQAGVTRTYYVAADEVMWDYAPRGRHLTGAPIADDETGATPTVFRKAVYREYSDASFSMLKPRPPEWEHLGILGPLIRAEVGDIVKVTFRNRTNGFFNMHPHGLAYEKDSEGALYNDGTSGAAKADDLLRPGMTFTYTWTVPPRAGPAPGDTSSILWMYHSHFVEPKDMNTGLLGPIVVTAKGAARPDGSPRDVDREFVAAFALFDETASAYAESNLALEGRRPANLRVTASMVVPYRF